VNSGDTLLNCKNKKGQESFSGRFKNKTGKTIIALTVKDILDEQIAYKLA
jgi:hypothetical protein